MKIPSQSSYNATTIDRLCRLRLRQDAMVKPLLYKKLTMTSEEKSKRCRVLDIEYRPTCIFGD